MNAFSKLTQPGFISVMTLALVLIMAPVQSFATANTQVARNLFIATYTAECCVVIGPTVKINELATPVPVIVTWSADYIVFDTVQFALSLNNGPCLFYGPFGGKPVRQWNRQLIHQRGISMGSAARR
jgi:hypothetical protein